MAKESGVKVIAITSHAKSPIGIEADISLIAYGRESDYRSEAMESRVTTLMLIDSLYLRLALLREEETIGNLNRIRKSISEKRF
jgi:DNA-binding MurR/RpiR family transcriptional regulator